MKIKAAVCHQFGQPLVIEEVDLADPQAGEVRVAIKACAVCHSDITYADGGWGGDLPIVFGHEAAGIVTDVGPGVTRAQVGDHVVVTLIRACGDCFYCVQGNQTQCETIFNLHRHSPLSKDGKPIGHGLRTAAFAEYVVVDQSQIMPIPETVPLDSASLLACGVITGLGAVTNTAAIPAGASVVVIGTGGVGLNSVQGAALSGAYPLIAIDLNDNKLEAAQEFGATHTINPMREDGVERVKALTAGRGVDFAFVAVGNAKVMEGALNYVRPGGALVIVGMPPEDHPVSVDYLNMAGAGQRILGSKMGSAVLPTDIPKLIDLYLSGRLKLDELITRRYALEEINEAIADVKAGNALRNVIVF